MIELPPLAPMLHRPVPDAPCWNFAALTMWLLRHAAPRVCGGQGSLFVMVRAQAANGGLATVFEAYAIEEGHDELDLILVDLDGARSSPRECLGTWSARLARNGVLLLHGWRAEAVEDVGDGFTSMRFDLGEGLLLVGRQDSIEAPLWTEMSAQGQDLVHRIETVSRSWLQGERLSEAERRVTALERAMLADAEPAPVHAVADAEPLRAPGLLARIANVRVRRRMARALRRHPEYFDPAWYAGHHPEAGDDTASRRDHFLKIGLPRNEDASPSFDARAYLNAYPDVAASGLPPLLHYLEFGMAEGRDRFPATDGGDTLAADVKRKLGVDLSSSTIFPVTVGIVWPAGIPLEALQAHVEHVAAAMRNLGQSRSDRILVTGIRQNLPLTAFSGSSACATVVPEGREPNPSAAHNRLMKLAFGTGAKIYVAVSAEIAVEPDALVALIRTVRASGCTAVVGGLAAEPVSAPGNIDVAWVAGQCLAIPKSAFDRIGGLDDQHFETFGADIDFCWRARGLGIPVMVCPLARYEWRGADHDPSDALRAAQRLAMKWDRHAEGAALLDEIEGRSTASDALSPDMLEYLAGRSRVRHPW